jgi:hypothetical protein
MSRELFLSMDEGKLVAACLKEKVGISAVERLPSGGVRLVCMSVAGADQMRGALKKHLITEDVVVRQKHRPDRPLW